MSQPALISSQLPTVGGHALTQRTKLVDEGNRTEMTVRTRRIDPRPRRDHWRLEPGRINDGSLVVVRHFVSPEAELAVVGLGITYGVDGWW